MADNIAATSTKQADFSVSGTITTQNLVPAGVATSGSAVTVSTHDGSASLGIQVTGTYTGALSLQGTIDGTNWVTIGSNVFFNVNTGAATATITSASVGIFQAECTNYQQVRITGLAAMTGTATVSIRVGKCVSIVAVDSPIPAGSSVIGAVTQSGTWNATINAAIAAGTNAIGDVGGQLRANATGAATIKHVVSAASTNATNVKASAGRVAGWSFTNTTASLQYVKLHNSAGTPTAGSGVVQTISIPASGVNNMAISMVGIGFSTGIAYTIVTGSADADATATTAGSVIGDIFYS